eukprot:Sspe_Gene.89405::Locus_61170_Transcript_1_1_Confidence_1.000_Length_532::g.89405::m.89405
MYSPADDYRRFDQEQRALLQQQPAIRRYDVSGLQIDEAIAREKREGVEQVEIGIRDIQDAQETMHQLVRSQGVLLDESGEKVSQAAADTKGGIEHLQKANQKARSTRKWMCCSLLLVIVIGGILAIIFGVAKK